MVVAYAVECSNNSEYSKLIGIAVTIAFVYVVMLNGFLFGIVNDAETRKKKVKRKLGFTKETTGGTNEKGKLKPQRRSTLAAEELPSEGAAVTTCRRSSTQVQHSSFALSSPVS